MKSKKSYESSSSLASKDYPSQNLIKAMNSSLSSLKKESMAGEVRSQAENEML